MPRPRVVDVCAALAGVGFGVAIGTAIIGQTHGSLSAPGGLLMEGAQLAGLTAAYLLLIMVLLVARLPWLELSAGQDRLTRWHRKIAPWAFGLVCAHVVCATLGYAEAASTEDGWQGFVATYLSGSEDDYQAAVKAFQEEASK